MYFNKHIYCYKINIWELSSDELYFNFDNIIVRNNEILHIIPLIGSIAMGISALPSIDSITALLPEIIKTMPDEANQIKHLINGEENKVDPSLFDMALFAEKTRTVSNDELTSRTIS